MKRYSQGQKYIYIDDDNKIVIITRHKDIGEKYALRKRNLRKQEGKTPEEEAKEN